MSAPLPGTGGSELRQGILAGVGAYALWGLFPLYFHALEPPATAMEVLGNRIVWTFVLMAAVVLPGERRWIGELVADRRRTGQLLAAAVLIAVNWGVYVWAVGAERVVEASLGYFICPLLSVLLGVFVLGERLRPLQWGAVALGAVAVGVLAIAYGRLPWVALVLAGTFTTYGFIKKKVDLPAARSLTVESALLAPVATAGLVVLFIRGDSHLGTSDVWVTVLLVGTGVVTAAPLVLFAASARRIPLSTVGLLQYITPTMQFMLGVLAFGEAMTSAQWTGFCVVWAALVLLSVDAVRATRAGTGGDEMLNPATAELG